eukprot:1511353-Pleurochrysis_carterae.AAC.4
MHLTYTTEFLPESAQSDRLASGGKSLSYLNTTAAVKRASAGAGSGRACWAALVGGASGGGSHDARMVIRS